ncbi:hypothetical protein CGX12_14865 [Zobellella denitrificans]|uniref:Uncharacterized protein n=1 Tax=Zobellella denitrificans TaxID=347534 RepID=A0A231MVV8_9GAMM|nr:hypothetical protein [Zobellella denitrificans]ATG73413.1 hypothetical protein AN401_05665 [Zobellella denitrificans]OXS14324.1 hypothetical protein CGX12_14865 [Zobellella denitrificans]
MKPTLLLALLWPALPALAIPLAPGVLSPGLYGSYGPGGDCQARPLVSLDDGGLYIVVGNKRGKVEPVDVCLSCAGGARYEGIEIWLSPQVADTYALHFRFNAGEQAGRLEVEDPGNVSLGANLRAVAAASPYRRCGPPVQPAG